MKINYQTLLDKELEKIEMEGRRPSLLLHVCCAPCSSYVLEYLSRYFNITVYFYNPNIYPEKEYFYRSDELSRFISVCHKDDGVEIICENYNDKEFYDAVKGLEHLGEKSERCRACYALRLERSALYAAQNGFDYFTTTLSISPHKNADWLNEIGQNCGEKYNIKYLVSDFKKKGGYKRSCDISKEYNMYRQDYCGCVFSKRETDLRNISAEK